jgi:hypothetical protein
MTKEFSDWWNDDLLSANNPYREDTPIYWAWEGWRAGREACLKMLNDNWYKTQSDVADAIRARGET